MFKYNQGIKDYIRKQKKICKQLRQWRYLSDEEQIRFENAKSELEVDNLMAASRKRSYEEYLSKQ